MFVIFNIMFLFDTLCVLDLFFILSPACMCVDVCVYYLISVAHTCNSKQCCTDALLNLCICLHSSEYIFNLMSPFSLSQFISFKYFIYIYFPSPYLISVLLHRDKLDTATVQYTYELLWEKLEVSLKFRSNLKHLLLLCKDGELYAGITSDFMSRDSAFFRSLGNRHVIRTEQYDSTWLQGECEPEKKKKKLKDNKKRTFTLLISLISAKLFFFSRFSASQRVLSIFSTKVLLR